MPATSENKDNISTDDSRPSAVSRDLKRFEDSVGDPKFGDPDDDPFDGSPGQIKTTYRFIHFEKYDDTGKTSKWFIKNNKSGAVLGHIKYYPNWREYCLFTVSDCVFNEGCLNDVLDFISQLTEQ